MLALHSKKKKTSVILYLSEALHVALSILPLGYLILQPAKRVKKKAGTLFFIQAATTGTLPL